MLDIKQLIKVTPISDEVKAKLLQDVDSYSEGKKSELFQTCWELISSYYKEKIRYELTELAEKSLIEEKSFTEEDAQGIREACFKEFLDKLEGIENQEEISEIREKLTAEIAKSIVPPSAINS
jgi:hypothetical protein